MGASPIGVDPAHLLRQMFDAAVAAALPEHCLPGRLPAPGRGRTIVVGAGKASAAMAAALEQHWRGELTGLVVTRYGHAVPCQRIEIVEAAHPVPDAAGRAAAERMLALVCGLDAEDLVICLLSGGGSALMTLPVAGVSFEDKQAVTRALLRSGADIAEMNCVRKHLSRIKGGKLAAAAYPARLLTLSISDVPGDNPATIGSGPTVGDPTTLADARDVLDRFDEMSNSGGSWGPDGFLYLSGHDPAEVYKMALPEQGSVLRLVEIVPLRIRGQGIAWDRSQPGVIFGIIRATAPERAAGIGNRVTVSRLVEKR